MQLSSLMGMQVWQELEEDCTEGRHSQRGAGMVPVLPYHLPWQLVLEGWSQRCELVGWSNSELVIDSGGRDDACPVERQKSGMHS